MSLLTLQVNMAASGTVESEAKVTDIHEALHSDTLEGRGGSQHTSDLQVNMTASGDSGVGGQRHGHSRGTAL